MFVPSLIRYRRGVAASRPKTTRTPSARIPIAISSPMIITIFLEPLRTMRSRRQPGMLTRPRLRWRFQTPVEDDRRQRGYAVEDPLYDGTDLLLGGGAATAVGCGVGGAVGNRCGIPAAARARASGELI